MCSPILLSTELNDIDLIENPILDFNINEICLLLRIVDLITFKFLNKNVGDGFPVPNGSNILILS